MEMTERNKDAQEPQAGRPTEDGGNDAAALHIPAPQPPAKPPRRTLVYPVLLDDGYMAQVVIPFDLSAAECQRMTAFLAALVVPWRV